VVTHLDLVIVAGRVKDSYMYGVLSSIELLNWVKNCHWIKVSIYLPVPMYGFTPTIIENYKFIVGYSGANLRPCLQDTRRRHSKIK